MRPMKLRDVFVDAMPMEKGRDRSPIHRNLPLAIKLPAHLGLEPLQELLRRRAVKSDVDLAGVRIDPELLHLWFLRKDSRHARINVVVRSRFHILL
jgi:hypothetical protein